MRPDQCVRVSDAEAFPIAFRLLQEEGISIGTSSAINVYGAYKLAKQLGKGHTVVTVLCDSGWRYTSKLFNPDFLRSKNIPLPHWLDPAKAEVKESQKFAEELQHIAIIPVDDKGKAIDADKQNETKK